MNEEVKKIIKASFCPKQKWIKDEDAPACFKCNKKFHPLFRRKHHCRYCGQVFCATCSDFSLSGEDLGLAEKTIRMCEACIQKCWKYIAKHDDQYLQFRKSGEHESIKELPANIQQIQQMSKCSFTQQARMKQIEYIIEEYSGSDMNGFKKLEQETNVRFLVLLQVILKQAKISLKHMPKISQKAQEIVSRMPPNFLVTGNMNVCQNIRIKGFWGEQFSLSLESIVLIKKAFTSKKIKEEYQKMICILVYGNIESEDLVGGDKEVSFENMINFRLKQMNKIISYCKRVKVNLIFLQGSIQKQFDDMLHNSNITVIPKVKVEYLSRLKVSLKIQKIVEGIGKVYEYLQKEINGFITRITSVNYISAKEGNLTKKFFKVETRKDELGLTLIIQDPSQKLLQNLKKQFKFILQTLVHLKLKVHRVKMDQNLLDSMSEPMRKSCYLNNSEMFFSFYSQFHHDILSYIKEKYVTYKLITYVDSDLGNYPEVTKGGIDEYVKGRSKSFKNKWLNFTEICRKMNDCHQLFYSQSDIPMGSYLLKKLTAVDKKCTVCCKPNYLHADMFYSTDQYMRIWVQSMIVDQNEMQQDCYLQFASQDQAAKNAQMEMIFSYLQKNTKQKMKCFIECFDCQQAISTKQNVYKPDLQFSTLSFLHNSFKGSNETTIRQNNTKVKESKSKNKSGHCQHIRKVRVFELGNKSVKFQVGKFTLNRQCILTKTGRQQFLKNKQQRSITSVCMLQTGKIQKIMHYLFVEIKEIAEYSKNPKFETIVKNSKNSFVKARQSVIRNGNLRLSQAQLIDILIPQLIEVVSKVSTLAQIMLSSKRITSFIQSLKVSYSFIALLKRCYLITIEVKKSVKKRQLDQKYFAKDFENDYNMMEDIDIAQLNQNSGSICEESDLPNSQNSKSEIYSNYQTIDTVPTDAYEDYVWLLPTQSKEDAVYSRHDRKTESNILAKKLSSQLPEEQIHKIFKLASSALKFDQAYFDFIPCYGTLPQSLIVAALNSKQHRQSIQSSNNFMTELTVKLHKYMENEVPLNENEELKKLINLIESQQQKFDIMSKVKRENSTNLAITMLYPNQFQILRRKNNIPIDLFISSIAGADRWLATGGKSGAPFMRSYNDLLVIKKITKTQFLTFRKFLPKYFAHLHQGSILTPIYGAFVIDRSTNIIERTMNLDYYIVMQNLFFGMKEWHLYDFKGSVTKRFSKPPVIPLDVNFLIDRFSQPIFCKDNVLKHLQATLDYLCENNVIDYSLILVVEIQNSQDYYLDGNRFQIGMVDYMREFGTGQFFQTMIKGPNATVIQPQAYKQRMLRNISKYFSQIPI